MFNRLYGTLTHKEEQKLFLLTNNIEWEILTTATSLAKLPSPEEATEVFTYMYHREDQIALYGFASEGERSLFLELIKITGIGPKQACKILSGISETLFLKAVDDEDVAILTNLPGLGKKTAQKIILSLRGKLTSGESKTEAFSEIIESLYNMGFEKAEIKRVVRELSVRDDIRGLTKNEQEQKLMKEAIVELSK